MKSDSRIYLGDGVYVYSDGYGLWLEANMPTTDRIYLEARIFESLLRYVESINKAKNATETED